MKQLFIGASLFLLSGCGPVINETIPTETMDVQDAFFTGSCSALDTESYCIDFLGSAWTEEDKQSVCEGMGTLSPTVCPTGSLGGCLTDNSPEEGIVMWYYNEGGTPYSDEDLVFAERSCDEDKEHSFWIHHDLLETDNNPVEITKPSVEEEKEKTGLSARVSTQDERIHVMIPSENEIIQSSPLKVSGKARGYWFFEASFPIDVVNWDGLIIGSGYAQADDNWMTEDFVNFHGEIEFDFPPETPYSQGWVIFQRNNPSDLSENDAAVEVPIFFDMTMTQTPSTEVCGEIQIQCVTTPCDPIRNTFSSQEEALSQNAKILYDSACE